MFDQLGMIECDISEIKKMIEHSKDEYLSHLLGLFEKQREEILLAGPRNIEKDE